MATHEKTRTEIDAIKDRLDIVDIIGKTVNLKHTGNGVYKGATNPGSKSGMSLNVDRNLQLFNDWANNGIKGDVLNWIAYVNNLDIDTQFYDVLTIAADMAGVVLQKKNSVSDIESQNIFTVCTAIAAHYHSCLTDTHRKHIFKTWGITDETIDRLNIGFAPVSENLCDVFNGLFHKDDLLKTGFLIQTPDGIKSFYQGRIVFPYWKNGKVVYSIARKTEWTPDTKFESSKYKKQLTKKENRTYISESISNRYFYGEDSLRGAKYCVITEGVTDCIMALQNGIPCVSPVTVRFRKQDYDKLLELVQTVNNVIICNDNEDNESGKKGAFDTAEFFDKNHINVRIIELPKKEGVDKIDLADFLKNNHVDIFNELIKNAKLFVVSQLENTTVSHEPLDNIQAANEFIINKLNGQGISYKTAFIENHIKNHFGFSSKVISDMILETKKTEKEKKKQDKINKLAYTDETENVVIPDDIKEEARRIMYIGDPVKFIIDTHSSLHIGDGPLARALLVSIGIQSVRNSDGIHPKVSGDSGKGKTHCCKAMLHLIPPAYKFNTTLSDKAVYYMKICEGAVIFSDDVDLSDGLQGIIKRATSNFQEGDTYTTLDKNREKQELTIPPRVAWWLTSVDDDQSIQLLNRQFGGGVNESKDQDMAVLEFQKDLLVSGEVNLPENQNVEICRCIIQDIKEQLYTVIIPYAHDMEWIDIGNRRNFLIFADIIKAFAVLRHRQRYHTEDGCIIADIEDYNDAKELYIGRAKNQGTKLTDVELRFCNILKDTGELDFTQLQKLMGVSQGRISQIIHGKGKGDSGLINKVKGLVVEKQTVRTDDNTTVSKKVCSLHNFNPLEHYETVITLKPGAEDRFYQHYPVITRILPEKNALPNYYITNITIYNRIHSNKLISNTDSTKKSDNIFSCEKGNIQGNKVITSQPIAKQQGNIGGNMGGILPPTLPNDKKDKGNIPKTAQLQIMRYIQDFKRANYSMTSSVDAEQFTYEFCQIHEHLKTEASRIKEHVEELNKRGWK